MKTFCCAKCCQDMSMPLLHLLFPDKFLAKDALELYKAHGLDGMLARDETLEFDYNGMRYKIGALALVRPDLFLDQAGQETYAELGFEAMLKQNVTVILLHRCAHLLPNNACEVYEDRPVLCRKFDCAQRDDCTEPLTLMRT